MSDDKSDNPGEVKGSAERPAEGPVREPVPLSRRLTRAVFALLLTLVCLEITACVGGRILAARGMFYSVPASADLAKYLKTRDPVLGWPSPTEPRDDLDASGSRIVPAFPDPSAPVCASLYGDSFTYGEDVDHEHAWGNVLAKSLKCRVANYGMGGYGTDQALLRYRQKKEDASKVVLLGLLTENILRNVNQYRELLAPGQPLSLKPRFIVGADGELSLIPMYTPSEQNLEAFFKSPEKFLEHEYFIPGGASGTEKVGFPALLSLIGLRKNYKIQAAMRGEPSHAAFYRPDHPSGGLAVTSAIARTFVKEASSRGAFGGVVIIPLPADLRYLRDKKVAAHAPLVEELTRAGVPHIDSTPKLVASLAGRDPCELYVKCKGGHFNEEGYRLLAGYVHDWLKEQNKP